MATQNLEFLAGYALVIGTGTNAKGKIRQRYQSTINDAEWIARVLQDKSLCAFPKSQVKVLLGREATLDNIIAALDSLGSLISEHTTRNAANDDDKTTLVVFFSGHGTRDNGDTYLIPYGYNFEKESPSTEAISGDFLHKKLKLSGADKYLLLINSCYSGGLAPKPKLGREDRKRVLLGPLTEAHIKKLSRGTGFAFMSSSQSTQESETGYVANNFKRYSPFTIGISRGFSGRGKERSDGLVYVTDLMNICKTYVKEKTKYKQEPHWEHNGDIFPVGLHKSNWSISQFPLLGEDLVFDYDEAVSDLDSEAEEEETYKPRKPTKITQNSVNVRDVNVTHGHVIIGSTFGNKCVISYNDNMWK